MTKKVNIEESFLGESDEQVVKNETVEVEEIVEVEETVEVEESLDIEVQKVEFLLNPIAFNMSNEIGDVTFIPLSKAIELQEAAVVKFLD